MSSEQAAAFAALEAILDGEWDRWLNRLHGAIHQRQQTDEYRATLLARDPSGPETARNGGRDE